MSSTRGLAGTWQERHAVLEAFADAASDALFGHDTDGRITVWNRSAERISGYGGSDLVGQPITGLFPEHLRGEAAIVYESVLAGDRVDRIDTELARRDGLPVPISLSVRPLADDDGVVIGGVSIAQDMTEVRLTQATLAEVEARRSGGEAEAHVGRWLWDVGSGAVQWSDELHVIHGVDPLEFAGTMEAHLACVHDDDRARVRAGMEAAVADAKPFEDEYRILKPGGDVRWIYVRAEPTLSSAGAVVGLRGIGQDVHDRRITHDRRGS